ncbi:Crp/Fnr family transcriptional regulator [Ruegeria sediminis]|uniref:Crp/Fnr family transcriptional regulator n=1 Tax=Ruegeria sediminis TaxID=2583820 RepID=A0ABY2X518_9RHOB|nr:Crp/Fnr family transcriptional regulator [Ruegeria sediminis]TMV10178.1 Crp/Fnr family transcriptional regulator [Ruegeria sediminis]
MSNLKCPAGTVLFRPGQECPGFVSLQEGSIRVSLTAANGREVVLYRVGPGDVCLQTFACLTDGRSYSAEGVAETDIKGEILPHDVFRRSMATDESFRAEVLAAVARRFADFEQLVEDVALTGFDARLARALLRLAQDGVVRSTHDALAAETASGRAFVSRRLAEFSRLGLVSLARGRISLLDRAGLERLAADER